MIETESPRDTVPNYLHIASLPLICGKRGEITLLSGIDIGTTDVAVSIGVSIVVGWGSRSRYR